MTNEFSCDVESMCLVRWLGEFCKLLVMKQNKNFLRLVIPRI